MLTGKRHCLSSGVFVDCLLTFPLQYFIIRRPLNLFVKKILPTQERSTLTCVLNTPGYLIVTTFIMTLYESKWTDESVLVFAVKCNGMP